ncbi:hypothetical protein Q0M94_24550 (plasmid) [Deinococcus radiomollis]|uniref:hypothetical protein n=1 Tax=Deinococcus radiomollis TaxID=468916 RepID=UPI00389255B4
MTEELRELVQKAQGTRQEGQNVREASRLARAELQQSVWTARDTAAFVKEDSALLFAKVHAQKTDLWGE